LTKHKLEVLDLGYKEYDEILNLQYDYLKKKQKGYRNDILMLVEHPSIYTIGRNGSEKNILVSQNFLEKNSIAIKKISRGGDIVYHGPGQIVGYPILDLNNYQKDLHWLLEKFEKVFLELLKQEFQIKAERIPGLTGVWVDDKKITFIGIGVKKWVTFHGFAFNVKPNIKYFDYIVPCGVNDKGVTSLERLLPKSYFNLSKIKTKISKYFAEEFKVQQIKSGD